MAWTRSMVLPIFGFTTTLACASQSKDVRASDGGLAVNASDCGDQGAGGDGGEQTDSAASLSDSAGSGAAQFLGAWTLVGTEYYVCATDASDSLPLAVIMTLRSGPGVTDGGAIDLLFDGGLGCSLAMSAEDGVATLTWAPQTCGVSGKPIDRVYTSVELAPTLHFPGWLRLEETFTDPSGCTFLVQGYMVPEL